MYKTTRGKQIYAYLAGIIDGEGSIFICRINNKKSGNQWYRLQVGCSMTEPQAIQVLREVFTPDTKQFIYRGGRKKGHKDVYQWLTTGKTAVKILKKLLPHLLVKNRQAKLAIEFQEWRQSLKNTGRPRNKKEVSIFRDYYNRMKALNLQPQRLSEETPIVGMR